jgi:hypothetical protein
MTPIGSWVEPEGFRDPRETERLVVVSEWQAMEAWPNCQSLARPGIVFELQNAQGQSLLARCGPLPPVPFDWMAGPVRFRAIAEPEAERSAPIPPPVRSPKE